MDKIFRSPWTFAGFVYTTLMVYVFVIA